MGNKLSNALNTLAGGLETIAAYRGAREEKEETRRWQKEMQDSQNAFQVKLSDTANQRDIDREKRGDTRQDTLRAQDLVIRTDERKQDAAIRAHEFKVSTGLQLQAINATRAAQVGSGERADARKLGAIELRIKMGSGTLDTLQKSLNEELSDNRKDPMLKHDPAARKVADDAAKASYAPQMEAAMDSISRDLYRYEEAVGLPVSFSGVKTGHSKDAAPAPAMTEKMNLNAAGGGGAGKMDDAGIRARVDAAFGQLGPRPSLSTVPSEAVLVDGFVKSGLSRAEAVKATRMLVARVGSSAGLVK